MQSIRINMWETWKENVDEINYIAQLRFIKIKIKVATTHTLKEIEKILLTCTWLRKQRNLVNVETVHTSVSIHMSFKILIFPWHK